MRPITLYANLKAYKDTWYIKKDELPPLYVVANYLKNTSDPPTQLLPRENTIQCCIIK